MVLRRVKNKIKKLVAKKNTKLARPARRRKVAAQAKVSFAPIEAKKEILGAQEMAVEQTKFSHPEIRKFPKAMPAELPAQYGKNKMVLQVRDPWWLYCYWEITAHTWDSLRERLKETFYHATRVLRVYDISHIIFNGKNAHRFFDIEVNPEANNWYIDAGGPGRSWCVDYGLRLPSGEFITVLRSNAVTSPLDGPSWITDEEWMVPEDMFGRLYGMGFGLGRSSPVGKWQERFRRALFSGILASPGITSAASPVKKRLKERKFWLVVDCELIVYGATEPDAKVTVQGRPIKLRPDGSFTLRYALPDGKQAIPVKAVSADEIEERTITPSVSRQTQTSEAVKEFVKEAV